ncbi:uncharacterized protein M421DRAFT_58880 [Didymella exigua CBS 183.55]|uniref:Uncharacterized protein n=1 Tax=Didymella exigua CBS 183.55 TaxID=1150837 RepID=A0A6A5RSQ9_9PLEO|nr:uncharacterized protein M421DRAFT_58880 [Didymella exigua CBS 183.55]KAF1930483.1 hypothetical protein M421DRAFT_58880 [Didymella exigua CBS 183.55]
MSSIQSQVHEAASQHAQLIRGLAETDQALSQLQQQDTYLKDLKAQEASTAKHVEELRRKTDLELKDHKKYSESTFRRFAHKATGRKERFAEKAGKEEREYFDAIMEQKTAEDELAYVRQLKAEAELQRQKFDSESTRHNHLQQQLDHLYNSIFAGQTPGFPEEDCKEEACNVSSQHVQSLHQELEKERHVLFLLRQTSTKLGEARSFLNDAHGMSQWDMFGGGTMVSMHKRNLLERAESSIQQVRMLQQQLQQVAPHLPSLGQLNIASGSIWGDIVFDNIFSDMEMHDKIKDSEAQVDRAGHKCGDMVRQSEQTELNLLGDVRSANERLKYTRIELQRAREEAFRAVLDGHDGDLQHTWQDETHQPPAGAPPGYDAAPPAYSA